MVTKSVTTINLSGETAVQFNQTYNYFWITNLGDDDVFASMDSGITEGADGVIIIPSGSSASTMHGYNSDTVYLSGNGKVQVMGTFSAFNPFNVVKKGGEFKTASGDDNYTLKTAEFPLLNLNVYGRSWQGYASHGGEPLGKNLFPWNDYTTAPFVPFRATVAVENSELVIATGSSVETKGAYISQTYIRDVLSEFDGKYITISAEMMTDMPNLSYSFGLDYQYKKVSLTDSWNRYSYSIEFDKSKSCGFHFFMQSETADTPTIKVRNIQIESGNTATEYEPYKGTPNPDCPVAIESVGNSGSLTVTTCGKNLFPWNDYNVAPFVPHHSSVVKAGAEIVISTVEGIASPSMGVYLNPKSVNNILGSFIGCKITLSVEMMTNSPGLQYTFGLDNNSKTVYLTDTWKKYSITFDFDANASDNAMHFYVRNAPSESHIFKVRNIQIEVGDATSEYEPYKFTTANITTGLPLRGIPVSSGGNYIDSKNQEWICDTIEHVYGENAQAVKRITEAAVASAIDMHGGSALLYEYSSPGDEFPRTEWYFESGQITDSGRLIGTTYLWRKYYDKYGDLITDQAEGPGGSLSTSYDPNKYKLIGDWKADDGSVSDLAEPLPYVIDNGEPIPDDYICTTGVLTEGATIIYPIENPVATALSAEEIQALNNLQTFSKITNIYNSENADMSVKYCASQTISDTILPIINYLKGTT